MRMERRVSPHHDIVFDYDVGSDRCSRADAGRVRNDRGGMDALFSQRRWMEEFQRTCEIQVWIRGHQDRETPVPDFRLGQNRGRVGLARECRVPRIREERQFRRAGLLQSCNPRDLEILITLEPASKRFGDLP